MEMKDIIKREKTKYYIAHCGSLSRDGERENEQKERRYREKDREMREMRKIESKI